MGLVSVEADAPAVDTLRRLGSRVFSSPLPGLLTRIAQFGGPILNANRHYISMYIALCMTVSNKESVPSLVFSSQFRRT